MSKILFALTAALCLPVLAQAGTVTEFVLVDTGTFDGLWTIGGLEAGATGTMIGVMSRTVSGNCAIKSGIHSIAMSRSLLTNQWHAKPPTIPVTPPTTDNTMVSTRN